MSDSRVCCVASIVGPIVAPAYAPNIKERISSVFNNERLSDIIFVVGLGEGMKRIPAHKFVLSLGSSVFDTMFNGSLRENSDEIEVPDVDPSAFLALLRFLYSDNVTISSETVLSTLYAAKKYAVPFLEAECVKFLKSSLTSSNAFTILSQARLFEEHELMEKCLNIIDSSGATAFEAEGFLDIDLDALCCVLGRDGLSAKEINLFEAVKKWSSAECFRKNLNVDADNQRNVSERALQLIRFPLMNSEEFSSHVAKSGLLPESDVISLYMHITSNQKPSIKFNSNPRRSFERTLAKNQSEVRKSLNKQTSPARSGKDRSLVCGGSNSQVSRSHATLSGRTNSNLAYGGDIHMVTIPQQPLFRKIDSKRFNPMNRR